MATDSTVVQPESVSVRQRPQIDLFIEISSLNNPDCEQDNPCYGPTVDVWSGKSGSIIIGSVPGHEDSTEVFISLSASDAVALGKLLIAAARKQAHEILERLSTAERGE